MDPDGLLSDAAFARRIAFGLLRDRDAAEDLVQETWLEILRNPPEHSAGLRGYLALVLRRLGSRRRRADAARAARECAVARGEAEDDTSVLVARAEIHARTVAALLALDEPYRKTVLLRFFEDLTPAEIAARERIPEETVRTRMKRAMALLRTRLERERGDWREQWLVALGMPRIGAARHRGASTAARQARLVGATALVTAGGLLAWWVRSDEEGERRAPTETASAAVEDVAPPRGELAPAVAGSREPPTPAISDFPPQAHAAALAGRVSVAEGRPLPGAQVVLVREEFEQGPELASAVCDGDGRFSLPLDAWTSLAPHQRALFGLALHVWSPGHRPLERSIELGDGDAQALELVLQPGRLLSGRVLHRTGEPVASAETQLRLRDADGNTRTVTRLTSREGWVVCALQDGEELTELVLRHPRGFAYLDEAALPHGRHGDVELGPITLEPGHVLRGRCVHPDGSAVRNLGLTAFLVEPTAAGELRAAIRQRSELALGHAQVGVCTDENGFFETRALRPGKYQIQLGRTILAAGAAFDANGPDIELVIDRHDLAIEVVDADGRAIDEARVATTILAAAGFPTRVELRTLTRGTPPIALVQVYPGEEMAVLAVVPGLASAEERVATPDAPFETTLRLRLAAEERGATLVLRPSAGPADAWRVTLCAPLSGMPLPGLQELVPDRDGRVSDLPCGSYRVWIDARLAGVPPASVPALAAGRAYMPVSLERGETVLTFDARPAALVRFRFAGGVASAAVPHLAAEADALHGADAGGTDLESWMGVTLGSSRVCLEVWEPEKDRELPFRRFGNLRPLAGQHLDVVVPAGRLLARVEFAGATPQKLPLTPRAGETVEVPVSLTATPHSR